MSRPVRTFVALGDSVTEGVGDPRPGGGLRGWADRLAEGLRAANPELTYRNLARRSLVSREVFEQQLGPALSLRPDLASALVGMNDVLHPGFDPRAVEEPLEELVAALAGAGATVLTATLPDVTRLLPLPARRKDRLREMLVGVNGAVRRVSERHRTVLVDAGDFPEELHARNWSLDRLHPNSRGHLLIARSFAVALRELRGVDVELPEPTAVPLVGAESIRHARWIVGHVAGAQARRLRARLPAGFQGPRRTG